MAKIVSMTPTGQWQEFTRLEIRFDNGDFGTAFAKSQTPSYAVGDEVEYTKNEKGTSQNPTPHLADLVEVTEAALPIPRKYRVMTAPLPSSAKLPSRQQ
jgi:hypothetical protein